MSNLKKLNDQFLEENLNKILKKISHVIRLQTFKNMEKLKKEKDMYAHELYHKWLHSKGEERKKNREIINKYFEEKKKLLLTKNQNG
jgi:hypothetical protein